MFKRFYLILICMCICISYNYAQDTVEPNAKSTVLVDYFTCTSSITKDVVDKVRNNALSAITYSGRVIVIDIESEKAQKMEQLRRTTGDLSVDESNNLERISTIGTLGAEYIVCGHVISITIVKKENKTYDKENPIKITYEGQLAYSIKVIRVKDGSIVASNSYTTTQTKDTEKEARAEAINNAGYSAGNLISSLFRLEGTILEVNKEKKDKAQEVYINIGSDNSLHYNTSFSVYAVRTVAGRTVNKYLGSISVIAVEGKDIALCKVKKGGDLILKAVREGEKIFIRST